MTRVLRAASVFRWTTVTLFLAILAGLGAGVVILVSQQGSSRSMRVLSAAFMEEVAARARSGTLSYLAAGPKSLEALRELFRSAGRDASGDRELERDFRALLRAHDEVEMFNLGWPNGDFMMVKRMPDGSLSTKRVRRRAGVAESTWEHDNPRWAGEAPYADRREPAAQAYDPRPRPWYRSASRTGSLSWVEPYVFYSDRMPGISCAVPLYDGEQRLVAVVGADIGITALSRLLATFTIGRSGEAVILTEDGSLIAYPAFLEEGFETAREVAGADRPELVLRRVADSPDSVLAAAFGRRPAAASGRETEPFTFVHDGVDYVARFESFLVGADKRWIVGIWAPQDDFMRSLRRDNAVTLAVTLICLVMAIGLAAFFTQRAAARRELELLRERAAEKQRFIEELEARNSEMERFTYTVSHDLKSPLITISGFLGLVQQAAAVGDRERMERDLGRIQTAVEKMSRLLEELLELSRVGRVTHPPEDAAMSEVAREAAEALAGVISRRGVEVSIAGDLPSAFCDRPRITEALQNLMENAIKFMGDQPAPRVEVGARRDSGETVYTVRDNGIGIEPRFHDRVFGLFDRLDTSVEGTGIGLAIVQRIIEVHHGRIWVESEGLGQGSTFCFTLPRTLAAES